LLSIKSYLLLLEHYEVTKYAQVLTAGFLFVTLLAFFFFAFCLSTVIYSLNDFFRQDFHGLFSSAANLASVSAKEVLKSLSPDYAISHKYVDASELVRVSLSIAIRVTIRYDFFFRDLS
jgi:hypothetical protein